MSPKPELDSPSFNNNKSTANNTTAKVPRGRSCEEEEEKPTSSSSMSVLISNLPTAAQEDDIMNTLTKNTNNNTEDEERTKSMSVSIDDDNNNNTVVTASLLCISNRRASTGDVHIEKVVKATDNNDTNGGDELLAAKQKRRSTSYLYYERSNSSRGLSSFSDLSNFLVSEGLLNDNSSHNRRRFTRSSSMLSLLSNLSEYTTEGEADGNSNSGGAPLSEQTNEALKDFALQLKFYGKEGLDYEAFNMLLDDIDYNENKPNRMSRDELWDELLTEVALASSPAPTSSCLSSKTISIQDLKNLYNSEPYKLSQQASFNNGEVLMSYIENLFRNADVNDDNTLQKDELKLFLRMLFDGREPTEDELNEVRRRVL